MIDSSPERREFKRVAFEARTELTQDDHSWPVRLLDLSLKGLLIERPSPWLGDAQRPFRVDIHLSPDVSVQMQAVRLTHDDHDHLGFACEQIDIASISHLRRLLEWNLADPAELERELAALIRV